MIKADKVVVGGSTENNAGDSHIENHDETDNVFKDLLRCEVTEPVKELRHEMYYSERKSHDYTYDGGGYASKTTPKNSVFSYKTQLSDPDDIPIRIALFNKQNINGIGEDNQQISDTDNFKIPISTGTEQYTIHIERDFVPRFRLEKYTHSLLVKDIDDTHTILELYVAENNDKINHITKLFQSELERIYQGNVNSDTLRFNKLWFITKDCYGAPDLFKFEYTEPIFDNITKIKGFYILRFRCTIANNGEDLLDEIYHQPTAEKCERHEKRSKNSATVSFVTEAERIETNESNTESEEKLFDEIVH